MRLSVAENWVEAPLKRFVDDARVRLAVLLNRSGQVLGQYGFARSVDVMTACALAAATTASSAELGRFVDGKPFAGLHYAGKERQILFSQDVCYVENLKRFGGGGYSQIQEHLIPRLLGAGVPQSVVDTITVENPRRLLVPDPRQP